MRSDDLRNIRPQIYLSEEHVSASRQDPNGVFLARAPVCSEFLSFRNLNQNPEQPAPETKAKPLSPLARSANISSSEEASFYVEALANHFGLVRCLPWGFFISRETITT